MKTLTIKTKQGDFIEIKDVDPNLFEILKVKEGNQILDQEEYQQVIVVLLSVSVKGINQASTLEQNFYTNNLIMRISYLRGILDGLESAGLDRSNLPIAIGKNLALHINKSFGDILRNIHQDDLIHIQRGIALAAESLHLLIDPITSIFKDTPLDKREPIN